MKGKTPREPAGWAEPHLSWLWLDTASVLETSGVSLTCATNGVEPCSSFPTGFAFYPLVFQWPSWNSVSAKNSSEVILECSEVFIQGSLVSVQLPSWPLSALWPITTSSSAGLWSTCWFRLWTHCPGLWWTLPMPLRLKKTVQVYTLRKSK